MGGKIKLESIGDFSLMVSDLVKAVCCQASCMAMTNEELEKVRETMDIEINYRHDMARRETKNG